jgi:hypothetical protein
MTIMKKLIERVRGWVTSWEGAPTTMRGRMLAIAAVWPPFLIPIVLYGWVLPTSQAREITATSLMILVIVGDIAVLSLVTIMLLFAKGNLRTAKSDSQA